jgi:hypothetical protein
MLDHKVRGPRETHAHRTAATTQRGALTQQVFNQRTLLLSNAGVFGSGNKLALVRFTLVILFAIADMAIFVVPVRSTLWARVSDDRGCCWPPCWWVSFRPPVARNRGASSTCVALPKVYSREEGFYEVVIKLT